jgi:hypothetical protein
METRDRPAQFEISETKREKLVSLISHEIWAWEGTDEFEGEVAARLLDAVLFELSE